VFWNYQAKQLRIQVTSKFESVENRVAVGVDGVFEDNLTDTNLGQQYNPICF